MTLLLEIFLFFLHPLSSLRRQVLSKFNNWLVFWIIRNALNELWIHAYLLFLFAWRLRLIFPFLDLRHWLNMRYRLNLILFKLSPTLFHLFNFFLLFLLSILFNFIWLGIHFNELAYIFLFFRNLWHLFGFRIFLFFILNGCLWKGRILYFFNWSGNFFIYRSLDFKPWTVSTFVFFLLCIFLWFFNHFFFFLIVLYVDIFLFLLFFGNFFFFFFNYFLWTWLLKPSFWLDFWR